MSQFSDYIKETQGRECIEREFGFVTYVITGPECYIEDIYVSPEFRIQGIGSRLTDMVREKAKGLGCTHLVGTVNGLFKDPTTSAKALLAYGFKIERIVQNVIIMKMEI